MRQSLLGTNTKTTGSFYVSNYSTKPTIYYDGQTIAGISTLRFDANNGSTADNPMAGHANSTEIKPYNISLLPIMVA